MSCKVIFTDTAKSDLLDVARSLAEISKDKAFAVRFVRELQQETARLEQFPESGAAAIASWSTGTICCSICMKKRRTPCTSWRCSTENGIICG